MDIVIEYHKRMSDWGGQVPDNAGRLVRAKLTPKRSIQIQCEMIVRSVFKKVCRLTQLIMCHILSVLNIVSWEWNVLISSYYTTKSANIPINCDVSFAIGELHQACGHVMLSMSTWLTQGINLHTWGGQLYQQRRGAYNLPTTYDRILVTCSSSTSRDHMPDEVRRWRTKRRNL